MRFLNYKQHTMSFYMMTKKNILVLFFITYLLGSCSSQNGDDRSILSLTHYKTPVNESLRGLCAVDDQTVWVSGSNGTYMRTTDGGKNWEHGSLLDSVDFRDIYAFDKDRAIMISAGIPAVIYKTTSGGSNWSLKYKNEDERVFFDAIDFWDELNGIAFSDAFDDRFFMIYTNDGGESWSQLLSAPEAFENEGGFAASGTNMVIYDNDLWIGTTTGRILHSGDRGLSWKNEMSPLENSENAAAGIFSLAFSKNGRGIMVGGDFLNPEDRSKNAAYLENGQWILLKEFQPLGYRSGVAFIPGSETIIATGPSGTDISWDNGKSWILLDSIGYHAVSFNKSNTSGWLSGSGGRVAKVLVE